MKDYSCVIIEAEDGEEFQTYQYEDMKPVPAGTEVGVEITEAGEVKFYLFDGIFYSN